MLEAHNRKSVPHEQSLGMDKARYYLVRFGLLYIPSSTVCNIFNEDREEKQRVETISEQGKRNLLVASKYLKNKTKVFQNLVSLNTWKMLIPENVQQHFDQLYLCEVRGYPAFEMAKSLCICSLLHHGNYTIDFLTQDHIKLLYKNGSYFKDNFKEVIELIRFFMDLTDLSLRKTESIATIQIAENIVKSIMTHGAHSDLILKAFNELISKLWPDQVHIARQDMPGQPLTIKEKLEQFPYLLDKVLQEKPATQTFSTGERMAVLLSGIFRSPASPMRFFSPVAKNRHPLADEQVLRIVKGLVG